MTTITVPARLEQIPEIEVTAAASSVTTALRSGASATSDVSEGLRAHGAPPGWTGDASEAASHQMTVIAADTDVVVAALEKATLACDAYVDQMLQLRREREALDAERTQLNREIDQLLADIEASSGEDVAALQARGERLMDRARDLQRRIEDLFTRVRAAEDRLVQAFGAVDTVAEGQQAAAGTRAEVEALRRELAALGNDAEAINAWWVHSLTPAQREALKISDPDLVGNTNGIPTGDRDEANRTSLDRDLDRLGSMDPGDLSAAERAWLERARSAEAALGVPGGKIDPITGEPVDVNLLAYDPRAFGGDGAVAVAFGDPDTADNTSVLVPGLTTDGTSIESNSEDAFRLFETAQRNGESAATIAWIGYDAPSWNPQSVLTSPGDLFDVGSVVREGRAIEGGERLAEFVDGLRATDTGDRSHLSVIAHSYGSTAASHAAATHGLDADALALIGSPGAGGNDVNHVSDLNMPEGKVYVGSAEHDFVTWLGRDGEIGMGQDPAQAEFGATRFGVDPGEEFDIETIDRGVANHTSYFAPGSQSLGNLTTIVQGGEPEVVAGRTESANSYAVEWGVGQAARPAEWVGERIGEGAEWLGERWEDVKGAWPW